MGNLCGNFCNDEEKENENGSGILNGIDDVVMSACEEILRSRYPGVEREEGFVVERREIEVAKKIGE